MSWTFTLVTCDDWCVSAATRTKLRGIVERYDKELEAATSFDERYANRENLKR
jgi:hypothetical protein